MKFIYIDLGTHNGHTLKENIKHHPQYDVCYCFEPNSYFHSDLINIFKDYPAYDIRLHDCAAWIEEGKFDFRIGKGDQQGSSLIPKKHLSGDPLKVECIDFSQWILDTFNIDDYICLNMDIEGAEYPVLNKMMKDKSIDFIDSLTVEFHKNKIFNEEYKLMHNDIISSIEKRVGLFKGYHI